jgi:hypothetical protein
MGWGPLIEVRDATRIACMRHGPRKGKKRKQETGAFIFPYSQ